MHLFLLWTVVENGATVLRPNISALAVLGSGVMVLEELVAQGLVGRLLGVEGQLDGFSMASTARADLQKSLAHVSANCWVPIDAFPACAFPQCAAQTSFQTMMWQEQGLPKEPLTFRHCPYWT